MGDENLIQYRPLLSIRLQNSQRSLPLWDDLYEGARLLGLLLHNNSSRIFKDLLLSPINKLALHNWNNFQHCFLFLFTDLPEREEIPRLGIVERL